MISKGFKTVLPQKNVPRTKVGKLVSIILIIARIAISLLNVRKWKFQPQDATKETIQGKILTQD